MALIHLNVGPVRRERLLARLVTAFMIIMFGTGQALWASRDDVGDCAEKIYTHRDQAYFFTEDGFVDRDGEPPINPNDSAILMMKFNQCLFNCDKPAPKDKDRCDRLAESLEIIEQVTTEVAEKDLLTEIAEGVEFWLWELPHAVLEIYQEGKTLYEAYREIIKGVKRPPPSPPDEMPFGVPMPPPAPPPLPRVTPGDHAERVDEPRPRPTEPAFLGFEEDDHAEADDPKEREVRAPGAPPPSAPPAAPGVPGTDVGDLGPGAPPPWPAPRVGDVAVPYIGDGVGIDPLDQALLSALMDDERRDIPPRLDAVPIDPDVLERSGLIILLDRIRYSHETVLGFELIPDAE